MSEKAEINHRFAQDLLNIFANGYNPQEYRNFWILEEGCKRSPYLRKEFNTPTAQKEHKCERGCKIERGHMYFRESGPFGNTKICCSCMAMILYYQNVWLFPVYQYDYWDEANDRPHFADDGEYAKTTRDILNG